MLCRVKILITPPGKPAARSLETTEKNTLFSAFNLGVLSWHVTYNQEAIPTIFLKINNLWFVLSCCLPCILCEGTKFILQSFLRASSRHVPYKFYSIYQLPVHKNETKPDVFVRTHVMNRRSDFANVLGNN